MKLLFLAIPALGLLAQTGALVPYVRQTPLGNNGQTMAGACMYTYSAGTTTPQTTYSNSGNTIPNTNPMVLDASGRIPAVYLQPVSYKFVFAQKSGNSCPGSPGTVIWSQDNIYDIGQLLRAALALVTGANLVGFEPTGGTVPTTVGAVLNSAFLYDTGYSTLALGCAAAATAHRTLAITQAWGGLTTQTLACDLWFPSAAGGSLAPSNLSVVTLSKTVTAAAFHIFDYSAGGTVVLSGPVPAIPVEWFGAIADGAAGTDNSTAVTRAAGNCATASGPNISIKFQAGTYRLTTGVIITSRGCLIDGAGISATNIAWTPTVASSDAFAFTGATIQTANGINNLTIYVPATNANARRAVSLSNQYRFRSSNVSVAGHATAGTNDGGVTGFWLQDTVDTLITACRAVNLTNGVQFSAASGVSTSAEFNHCNLESNTANGALIDKATSILFVNDTFQANAHAATIGATLAANVVIRDSSIGDDNTATPIVIGGTGSSSSISNLVLSGNTYTQTANSDAAKVVIKADWATISLNELSGYNPNVFVDGFLRVDCTKTRVYSQYDPTKGIQMGAFPFINDSSCYYGFAGAGNFRSGGLALPNVVTTNNHNWIDYSSPPVGCLDVQPAGAAFLADVPTGNFVDGQFACISVHNARGGATTVTFVATFSMDVNSRVIADGFNQTFWFQYHASAAWAAKPWAFVSESPVNVN